MPEIHVHLVGAVPNGLTVEYMPRLFPLWKAVPEPVDGDLLMPTAPGLGLEFDQAAIDKYPGLIPGDSDASSTGECLTCPRMSTCNGSGIF